MIRFLTYWVIVLAGVAAVAWVGAGYVGTNPLALTVTALIAACYLAGVAELWRYRRTTTELAQSLDGLSAPPARLEDWLATLPAGLRQPVRRRVEGERVALPGPALAPYLTGLLVLLGMLGTFLGMVATLRGTGVALESAGDLQAMRAALAAPVKGLGFAFGTSVAGVAASALLGLLTALCRRERLRQAQALDARIATTLRAHAPAHQREAVVALLERQSESAPLLADRLEKMVATLEQRQQALDERLAAGQADFHARTEAAYTRLAESVGQSLRESAAESGRAAGAGIQPVVETLLAGLASGTAAWQETSLRGVQRQLDGLSERFEALARAAGAQWTEALAAHEQRLAGQAEAAEAARQRYADTFERRSDTLLAEVSGRLETAAERMAGSWQAAMARQEQMNEAQVQAQQSTLSQAAELLREHASALAQTVSQAHERQEQTGQALAQAHQSAVAQTAETLQGHAAELARTLAQAHVRQEQASQALAEAQQAAAVRTAELLDGHAAAFSKTVADTHEAWQAAQAAQEAERLSAWRGTLESLASDLRAQWVQAGEQAARQQQAVCEVLERTAAELCERVQGQSSHTITEVERLVDAATQAPQAAASLLSELHQRLADGMARDAALLQERAQLLEKLDGVLDAVGQSSAGQQAAVQSLVESTTQTMERVGERFAGQVESGTGRLSEAVDQIAAGAAEVGSLGAAFGAAVQAFSQAGDAMLAQLGQVEAALSQSMARSDEQLAYYVAQAREVIDLSVLSQRQIIEDLQQLAGRLPADEGKPA